MHQARFFIGAGVLGTVLLLSIGKADEAPFEAPPSKPLSAREEQMTFRLPKGLVMELVAAEPDVVDPVALAFDERGRLFVAEMAGYPNGGVGTGTITSGRIKLLEDSDGDGIFERSTLYADGLRFPTSVMPYRGGLLVANAPDLLYLEDRDGDGKAEKRRVLYTGFDVANIQQLLSGLQWGLDNWVHANAGGKGGAIRSGEDPKAAEVVLRGRGLRFRPDEPGSLEPTSGGGQFGLAADEWGHWFVSTNSQHLRHIVLPDHYLARNPNLPVSAVTIDIPDHGPACKVHRISPFESWRVERTRRRKGGDDSKRFATTELVPGGFITSGTSPLIYLADLLPKEYQGNVFICDPANNLIHRDRLEPSGGATYVAKRGDADCEFLASTDNWFRPVWLSLGPDGAIYVADFYREVIETPLSLPEDMKKVLPLQTQGRGRIWRIRAEGKYQPVPFDLTKTEAHELVQYLDSPNYWWRITAQRLLHERWSDKARGPLEKLLASRTPPARLHALATLDGARALSDAQVLTALADPEPGVRAHALKLAEPRLAKSSELRKAVAALAEDASAKVRFQLAFTLGAADAPELVTALARIARRDVGDSWTQLAVLSSARNSSPALLTALVAEAERNGSPALLQFMTRVAQIAATTPSDAQLAQAFQALTSAQQIAPWQLAVLEGLGQGLQNSGRSMAGLWTKPSPDLRQALDKSRPLFARAEVIALDEKQPLAQRLASVRLLAYAPFDSAKTRLLELVTPQQPQEMQLAAVRSLGAHAQPEVATLLLGGWESFGPTLRREVSEVLFARPERVSALLDALALKRVIAGQLEPARLDQLRKHADPKVRAQAVKLLAGQAAPDRQKVVEAYRSALELKAETARGKLVFKKNCATCHRLENDGIEVGADLQSVLANKSPERLLEDILDPSREVDPRFINYLLATKDGRVMTGLIAAETASSVTLHRAEKAEDTVLRNQIESITATAKSVMPEELERLITRQDMADLIAYLQGIPAKK